MGKSRRSADRRAVPYNRHNLRRDQPRNMKSELSPMECRRESKFVRITLNLGSFLRTLPTRRPLMVAASEGRFKFCVYGETPQSKISFRRSSRNYRKAIARK